MRVIYFDEVKYEKGKQPYYWLGAIAIESTSIQAIEKELDELSKSYFGSPLISRETEFHASDIYHRKKHFKTEKNHSKRLDLLKRLAEIASDDRLDKICVRIEPGAMFMAGDRIPGLAFMYLVERVDAYLTEKDDVGLLIGDRESSSVAKEFAEALSAYRSTGTHYEKGCKVERLIDTVHFTESHLSRMLQLADAFIWLFQFHVQFKGQHWGAALNQHIESETNLRSRVRYKTFPTALSRLQVPR